MKLDSADKTETASPDASRVPAMLALVAGFLFAVLPLLLARWITPWFSGSATVWVQTLAVAVGSGGIGLIFGRWIQEKMAGNAARWLPILGLLGAIFSLPANPGPEWMIPAPSDATIALLELLLAKCLPVTMALGVVVGTQLAPTDAAIVGRSTAVGAIAGAFLFLLLDNLFTNARLAVGFSWGMLIFALLFAVLRLRVPLSKPGRRGSGDEFETGARVLILKLALTGIATAMLFVVSAKLLRDTASVPQLWVLPVVIYLLAALAAFNRPALQQPAVISACGAIGTVLMVLIVYLGISLGPRMSAIVLYLALGTFTVASFGTLVRLAAGQPMGSFQSRLAFGTVLGAIVIAYVPPRIATDYTEFHVVTAVAALILLIALSRGARRRGLVVLGLVGVLLATAALGMNVYGRTLGVLGRVRSFYGVTSAMTLGADQNRFVIMLNGDALQAAEYMAPEVRLEPAFQHGRATGIGYLFRALPKGNFRRVGIIGAGIGNLVAYAHPTDVFRLYDYDTGVALAANTQFGYLPQADFDWDFVLGDPRLVLNAAAPEKFDVLILDTFNREPLPYHLLTREAFGVWMKHLAPDGVIAVNTTHQRFDLLPVVWRQALELGLQTMPVVNPDDPENLSTAAEWVLLTNNAELLKKGNFQQPTPTMVETARTFPLWSDETARPISVLR